jgi:aryl-alcohol dehydrogenase-like predicted oxidoreductase
MANQLLRTVSIEGTGLDVPVACVGTMMFGKRADEAESQRIVDAALDHGINFFDTADMYQNGESERLLGRALRGRRDRCIVATKVGYRPDEDGKEEGMSREAILRAIDRSLDDLGTDHVDVYYLHRPDYRTPIEETLAAMDEVIRAGKVRHFGLSNFAAWQSLEVLNVCDANGSPRPVMTQMIYNLLVRQIEHEYVSFCETYGLHLTVYNPLAAGLLTGKYASLDNEEAGGRFVDSENYRRRYWSERFFDAMLRLKDIAADLSMSLTHLALNWVVQRGTADSVLLGPSSPDQLIDCIAAGEHPIPDEGMQRIAEFLREFDGTDATYAR